MDYSKIQKTLMKWAPVIKHPSEFRRSDVKKAVSAVKKALEKKRKMDKKGGMLYRGGASTNDWGAFDQSYDLYEKGHVGRLVEPEELRSMIHPQEDQRILEIANWKAEQAAKRGFFNEPQYLHRQAQMQKAYENNLIESMGGEVMEDYQAYGGGYGNPYPFSYNYF